jgi:RND family efflux transporter MFP subunit
VRKRWPLIITAVSLAFASSACSAKETSGVQEEMKEAKNVEVTAVKKESLDVISNLSGTLLPYEETIVSFEVGGRILDMSAKIGDPIKKGTILTKLDPTEYQLQVEKADKAVLEAQAAIGSADAAIGSADAGIQSADVGIQSAEAGIQSSDEAIRSAEANIKAANSRIHSVQASLDELNKGAREQEKTQAKLALERAKEAYNKIKTDAQRIKGLYEEGLVSKKEYEEVQLQLSNAQKDVMNAEQSLSLLLEGATEEKRKQVAASLEEAQAGKEQAEAGKGQAAAQKGQANASREQAVALKEQAIASRQEAVAAKERSAAAYEQALVGKEMAEFTLSKTVLKAPISGVVLEKFVSNGQMVNAGSSIYRLGRTDQLKVLLPVPDKEIKEWKVGQAVNVALYDQVKKGKVSKIYPQTNASTGTISVEVVVPNDKLDWFPGQVVKANRISSDNNGILVPVEAVISNGDKPYVFKAVNDKAVKTFVETGQLIDNKLHIVSGLEEGDKVVVRGADLLFDGDPLKAAGGKKK